MKIRINKIIIALIAAVILPVLISWNFIPEKTGSNPRKINKLTKAEKKEGWKLLFDGKTLSGWRGLGRDHVPVGLWVIEGGMIKKVDTGNEKNLPDGRPIEGGDLITIDTYENFELTFEWKVNKQATAALNTMFLKKCHRNTDLSFQPLVLNTSLLMTGMRLIKAF